MNRHHFHHEHHHPLKGFRRDPNNPGLFINTDPSIAEHIENVRKEDKEHIAQLHERLQKVEKLLAHFVVPKPVDKE